MEYRAFAEEEYSLKFYARARDQLLRASDKRFKRKLSMAL